MSYNRSVGQLDCCGQSNHNHASKQKQSMQGIEKYTSVSDEGTLTRCLGVHFTTDGKDDDDDENRCFFEG